MPVRPAARISYAFSATFVALGLVAAMTPGATATPAPNAAPKTAPTAEPKSAQASTSAPRTVTLDGVKVALRPGTRQVITVNRTKGSHARVSYWGKRDGKWRLKARTKKGRIGYAGLVPRTKRRQGSGTTPLGTYDLPSTFGAKKPKATWSMPYRRFDSDDYWVLDNESAFYNSWRDRADGGFRWDLPASDPNASERLVDFRKQYEMAVVIGFNTVTPVRGRGGAIFLHVNGKGATAGCVGVPRWFMRTTMHRLSPGLEPVIAIGR